MASHATGFATRELSKKTLPDFERLFETHPAPGLIHVGVCATSDVALCPRVSGCIPASKELRETADKTENSSRRDARTGYSSRPIQSFAGESMENIEERCRCSRKRDSRLSLPWEKTTS
jgi:hypothetical protein